MFSPRVLIKTNACMSMMQRIQIPPIPLGVYLQDLHLYRSNSPKVSLMLMYIYSITYFGRATALKCRSALECNFFLSLRYSVYSNQAATTILFSLLAMWALARRVFGPSFISSQCSQRWSHATQQWWTLCKRERSLSIQELLIAQWLNAVANSSTFQCSIAKQSTTLIYFVST